MFDHLHWLPLIARIKLKVPTLISRSHNITDDVTKYLRDRIRLASSTISLRKIRSIDRHDHCVLQGRTPMAQKQSFESFSMSGASFPGALEVATSQTLNRGSWGSQGFVGR